MRDAIVFSNWSWDMFNVPERIALALAMRGARVLYCQMPVSRFRRRAEYSGEIEAGVYVFRPEYLGEKFDAMHMLRSWQWTKVAESIQERAKALGLNEPVFLYSHAKHMAPLCRAMKAAGMPLVHICMDYPEPYQYELIELSDRTMVISKAVFAKLRSKYGEKIEWIPQSIHLPAGIARNGRSAQVEDGIESDAVHAEAGPQELAAVSHPRLGYLGTIYGRLNLRLLREVLERRPDWHFVLFGDAGALPLPNVHGLPWMTAERVPALAAGLDVGVMPYDCFDEKNLHCVPLKVFDYFLAGIPVVSTPVISLAEFRDIVYFGDTPAKFERAVECALAEPGASPKRQIRKEAALRHSTEALGLRLEEVLGGVGKAGTIHN